MSGQDEPSTSMWLATRAGKMALSNSLGCGCGMSNEKQNIWKVFSDMLVVGNEDKLVIGASPYWKEVNACVFVISVFFLHTNSAEFSFKNVKFWGCYTVHDDERNARIGEIHLL